MLKASQLRDYKNWVGKTALEVRQSARVEGGWANVFKDQLPRWASRVRNYFNESPRQLRLVPQIEAAVALARFAKDIAAAGALTNHVYQDRSGRYWFAMPPAGAVHHYPGKVSAQKIVGAFLTPQDMIPVFKLVSPDDTGGSCEICVDNPQVRPVDWIPVSIGKGTIGKANEWVNIRRKIVLDPLYLGTYNYSEVSVMGYSAHDMRDVKPHLPKSDFYLDPGVDKPLRSRQFPEIDGGGATLATQIH